MGRVRLLVNTTGLLFIAHCKENEKMIIYGNGHMYLASTTLIIGIWSWIRQIRI